MLRERRVSIDIACTYIHIYVHAIFIHTYTDALVHTYIASGYRETESQREQARARESQRKRKREKGRGAGGEKERDGDRDTKSAQGWIAWSDKTPHISPSEIYSNPINMEESHISFPEMM